jgi:hypothetical protein
MAALAGPGPPDAVIRLILLRNTPEATGAAQARHHPKRLTSIIAA